MRAIRCLLGGVLLLASQYLYSQCNTSVNLALGRPAFASSLESSFFPASNAFDGDSLVTRWSSQFSDPQNIYVDLGAIHQLCQVRLFWEVAYALDFTIDLSDDGLSWTPAATITGNTLSKNVINITGSGRYVRMNGTARGTTFGYSLVEFKVFGIPNCNVTNLALNKTVVASSSQSGLPAIDAVDGDQSTRWGSDFSDLQFIYVDLGAAYQLCEVTLEWEAAFGRDFDIDISNDALSWTTAASIRGNTLPLNVIPVTGSGRYVRMNGLVRATGFGYSLYEFEVTGVLALPVKLRSFTAEANKSGLVQLKWVTESEQNSSFFVIERSTDGEKFSEIGRARAAGNSSTQRSYGFVDGQAGEGVNYYRLKQVDQDGRFEYFRIVQARVQALGGIHVFPNPVKDVLSVSVAPGQLIRQVQVYNQYGALAIQQSNAGSRLVRIAVNTLPKGTYLVKIHMDGGTVVRSFIRSGE